MEEIQQVQKKRHGCVSAWLSMIIIFSALSFLLNFFASNFMIKLLSIHSVKPISKSSLMLLGILAAFNTVFAIMLSLWKKWGFWGIVVTSILIMPVNISIGVSIGQSLLGLVGIAILYGILQFKGNNVSAWKNLE